MIEALLRYHATAHFDELLDVTTWVLDVSNSHVRWAYEFEDILTRWSSRMPRRCPLLAAGDAPCALLADALSKRLRDSG